MPNPSNSFLEFWAESKAEDPARTLADAHAAAMRKLADLRQQTLAYVRPINNGKAWAVGFDPDKIDEVAALGNAIDEESKWLKSICKDIEAFLEITGGEPILGKIFAERDSHMHRRLHCERVAGGALKRAMNVDPHTSPSLLMQRNDIKSAYSALERAKAETEKPIAELEEKMSMARAIISKYE